MPLFCFANLYCLHYQKCACYKFSFQLKGLKQASYARQYVKWAQHVFQIGNILILYKMLQQRSMELLLAATLPNHPTQHINFEKQTYFYRLCTFVYQLSVLEQDTRQAEKLLMFKVNVSTFRYFASCLKYLLLPVLAFDIVCQILYDEKKYCSHCYSY